MRLLSYDSTGSFSLTDYPPDTATNIPPSDTKRSAFAANGPAEMACDTFGSTPCCIDKSSSAELTQAINSMFRWYRDATKCYAYLQDVSSPAIQDSDRHENPRWKVQFAQSRWFTRGWTLQELIAPKTVDFHSREGTRLGDKKSLERIICDITGIPARALRGGSLSHFTTSERMAWVERRKTTVPEDKAYSMLGIFDIHIPLIHGSQHEEFSVPFSLHGVPEISQFVAREQELAKMRDTLQSDGHRRVVVLHGLGGMGKTQLAIEYMKQHRDNYSAIFWLNIKDENSLKQSFARIAHQIKRQHPAASRLSGLDIQENLDETIDAVKAWLSLPSNSRWLMVYDNYDNPTLPSIINPTAVDIREYFPESYQGSIIITTRSSQVKIGDTIQLSKMQNLDDSLEILSTTSKRKGLINKPDAVNLAKQLDGLPLALATAGAYLEQTSTTFRSYLCLYKDSWARLQISSPELSSYEDRTLYSTWQLSLDQIQRENKHSAALLRLWAYFDNQDIWLELLQSYRAHNLEWIYEITKDELSFNDTIRTLSTYGLIEVDFSINEVIESRGYSVHSCVHSWMTHVLNREWSIDLAKFTVSCIASHVPDQNMDKWWLTQRRLLQHALKQNRVMLYRIIDDETSWIFYNLGILYSNQGKLKEAEEMYQRALQGYEKALGPDHTSTLNTVNNLGLLYSNQGKLKEAEEMYQRALQGYQTIYGLNHPGTHVILNNIQQLTISQTDQLQHNNRNPRTLQWVSKITATIRSRKN
ncbi:hypothetical protein NPX13_g4158 [Xylaria arbuscula]|uniref:NB-ARC domain-containing protein n=1 Tax=Xylaria arbuscula TaxID=114810 RepID=A0A9W8NG02_9PEZI|nr:hypothetical protein NPX13_g4158 [Xylaria arbuscula]